MPTIRPLRTAKDAGVRQPKPPFRSLPANSLHIGPSGSSKTYTLIATLTQKDMLGGMFDRYELYAANIHQDPQYQVLIDYVEKTTGQKREDFCHSTFDQDAIRQLMEDQRKTNSYLRKIGAKRLVSCCLVCDDFGEDTSIVRKSDSVLNSLFSRGRHLQISVYGLLLQRFKMAGPNIRYNAHVVYVHKLNSAEDLDILASEYSASVGGKENFIKMYKKATAKRYGFLMIVTGAEPRFYSSYDFEIRIKDEEPESPM